MSLPFVIARRYLFSKKSNSIINVISIISMVGIALATMAMVCVLSGFNGFKDIIGELFTTFDPQLVVEPIKGTDADDCDATLLAIRRDVDVAVASNIYEDNALILFKGHPVVIRLKGVDDSYVKATNIKKILVGEGHYELERAGVYYGIPGIGLANDIGSLDFGKLQLCVPKKGERINVVDPTQSINVADIMSSGLCFEVHQQRYDAQMMLCSIDFARQLFSNPDRVTAVELRLQPDANVDKVKVRLQQLCKGKFSVKNRYEQHSDTYRLMNIEKLFAFIFLTFIAFVATLNIVGAISMLMIDKTEDVETFRSLGMKESDIINVFILEGRMIVLIGTIIGLLVGLCLCVGQQYFGWITLGDAQGTFIIDSYPISIHWMDVLLTFFTILIIGFIAVRYPVKYFARKTKLGAKKE